MARPRSKTGGAKKRSAATTNASRRRGRTSSQYVCPECGAAFERPQALGAHRRQAHGVTGTSKRSRSRQASAGAAGRKRRPAAVASSVRSTQSSSRDGRNAGAVDRDRLLQSLFPNGIPAREDVISEVKSWLDQAERLAQFS